MTKLISSGTTVREFLEAIFPQLDGEFIEARLINASGVAQSQFYETAEQFANAAP